MKLEILLSCMHQEGFDIIEKSNIHTDALIINQCNHNSFDTTKKGNHTIRMISTTDRGLSKSRNLAIEQATGDIGIICDDDEVFIEGYEEKIISAFQNYSKADIIIFSVIRKNGNRKTYPTKVKRLNPLACLNVTSFEIAFRIQKIKKNKIRFNEQIGSGVSNAGGEENIFLHDCIRKGLSIFFVPITLATIEPGASQWSNQLFSRNYFIDRGKFTKRLIGGKFFAILYALYFSIAKYNLYKNKMSMLQSLKYMLYGILKK